MESLIYDHADADEHRRRQRLRQACMSFLSSTPSSLSPTPKQNQTGGGGDVFSLSSSLSLLPQPPTLATSSTRSCVKRIALHVEMPNYSQMRYDPHWRRDIFQRRIQEKRAAAREAAGRRARAAASKKRGEEKKKKKKGEEKMTHDENEESSEKEKKGLVSSTSADHTTAAETNKTSEKTAKTRDKPLADTGEQQQQKQQQRRQRISKQKQQQRKRKSKRVAARAARMLSRREAFRRYAVLHARAARSRKEACRWVAESRLAQAAEDARVLRQWLQAYYYHHDSSASGVCSAGAAKGKTRRRRKRGAYIAGAAGCWGSGWHVSLRRKVTRREVRLRAKENLKKAAALKKRTLEKVTVDQKKTKSSRKVVIKASIPADTDASPSAAGTTGAAEQVKKTVAACLRQEKCQERNNKLEAAAPASPDAMVVGKPSSSGKPTLKTGKAHSRRNSSLSLPPSVWLSPCNNIQIIIVASLRPHSLRDLALFRQWQMSSAHYAAAYSVAACSGKTGAWRSVGSPRAKKPSRAPKALSAASRRAVALGLSKPPTRKAKAALKAARRQLQKQQQRKGVWTRARRQQVRARRRRKYRASTRRLSVPRGGCGLTTLSPLWRAHVVQLTLSDPSLLLEWSHRVASIDGQKKKKKGGKRTKEEGSKTTKNRRESTSVQQSASGEGAKDHGGQSSTIDADNTTNNATTRKNAGGNKSSNNSNSNSTTVDLRGLVLPYQSLLLDLTWCLEPSSEVSATTLVAPAPTFMEGRLVFPVGNTSATAAPATSGAKRGGPLGISAGGAMPSVVRATVAAAAAQSVPRVTTLQSGDLASHFLARGSLLSRVKLPAGARCAVWVSYARLLKALRPPALSCIENEEEEDGNTEEEAERRAFMALCRRCQQLYASLFDGRAGCGIGARQALRLVFGYGGTVASLQRGLCPVPAPAKPFSARAAARRGKRERGSRRRGHDNDEECLQGEGDNRNEEQQQQKQRQGRRRRWSRSKSPSPLSPSSSAAAAATPLGVDSVALAPVRPLKDVAALLSVLTAQPRVNFYAEAAAFCQTALRRVHAGMALLGLLSKTGSRRRKGLRGSNSEGAMRGGENRIHRKSRGGGGGCCTRKAPATLLQPTVSVAETARALAARGLISLVDLTRETAKGKERRQRQVKERRKKRRRKKEKRRLLEAQRRQQKKKEEEENETHEGNGKKPQAVAQLGQKRARPSEAAAAAPNAKDEPAKKQPRPPSLQPPPPPSPAVRRAKAALATEARAAGALHNRPSPAAAAERQAMRQARATGAASAAASALAKLSQRKEEKEEDGKQEGKSRRQKEASGPTRKRGRGEREEERKEGQAPAQAKEKKQNVTKQGNKVDEMDGSATPRKRVKHEKNAGKTDETAQTPKHFSTPSPRNKPVETSEAAASPAVTQENNKKKKKKSNTNKKKQQKDSKEDDTGDGESVAADATVEIDQGFELEDDIPMWEEHV